METKAVSLSTSREHYIIQLNVEDLITVELEATDIICHIHFGYHPHSLEKGKIVGTDITSFHVQPLRKWAAGWQAATRHNPLTPKK